MAPAGAGAAGLGPAGGVVESWRETGERCNGTAARRRRNRGGRRHRGRNAAERVGPCMVLRRRLGGGGCNCWWRLLGLCALAGALTGNTRRSLGGLGAVGAACLSGRGVSQPSSYSGAACPLLARGQRAPLSAQERRPAHRTLCAPPPRAATHSVRPSAHPRTIGRRRPWGRDGGLSLGPSGLGPVCVAPAPTAHAHISSLLPPPL